MVYSAWQTAALKVYDRDATTLRDEVSAKGIRWTDELKGEGGANYTVPWLQAALDSDPDLLRDAIVKAFVPLTDGGTPEAVMAWLSQPGQGTLVGDQEDAGRQETPSCRGIRALIDDWVQLHDGGLQPYGGDTRAHGFMSSSYDDSGWSAVQGKKWINDDNASRAGFPAIFGTLDPNAYWIGLEDPSTDLLPDGAVRYFRATYDNPEERFLRVYLAADNYGDLWVNAEPVYASSDSADAYGWKDVQEPWQRKFPAGPITFAAKVRNAALTFGANPVGLIMTVVTLDANGDPDEVVFHTNLTDWKVTDEVTGVTGASIYLDLNDEADDRGIESAGLVTPTFTRTTSSAPESATWEDLQEKAIEVGQKGGTIVSDLELASFDLDMRPDLSLAAYVDQGSDVSASVAITKGATLLSYTYDGQPLVATRLLVKTTDRWLYLTDSGAEATYAPREHFLESGLALSPEQGEATGEANLDDLARESFAYTAVIVCTTHPDSVTPYLDFGKGDIISAYDYRMNRADLQVVSISGEVPDDGIVRWTLELREP